MAYRPEYERVILIGSTARKAGKTTYITKILRENPGQFIAIKIQASLKFNDIVIWKEEIQGTQNDTQKYLSSGAKESYLVNCPVEKVMIAFEKLYKTLGTFNDIICESTSLVKYIKPKKFVLFKKTTSGQLKAEHDLMISYADEIIS